MSELNGIKKIGLIAGNGRFPLLFAGAARHHGLDVVAIAIKKDTSHLITPLVNKVYWLSLKDYARMFDIFKNEGIRKVIMAGQVNPQNLFYKDVGDKALKVLLAAIKDKRPDTVFGAVADQLAEREIELIDSTFLLEDFMAKKGVLTSTQPDTQTWDDIRFGFDMAKKIAGLDIGQTLVVKNGAIVAVEAIEGTDACILRGGKLAAGGIVVIKVSKPNQDMRFDVPVVGPRTIKYLSRVHSRCLAIEADKTLVIDRELCVKAADRNKISIVAL
ncbi:MAG: UDP-2,3-diacylglucosamine diphosphatase LpxI [Candidatus Omnitrophica bacterium]|nr:UDP-2,3-diacylglucosamine diphosphatase LpxI [Candidatus Omnitrophota bacterium]